MRDWLVSPSLGQYLRVLPGKKGNGTQPGMQSTKSLLKKHMVDTFFEQALHQIDPDRAVSVAPAGLEAEVGTAIPSTVVETDADTGYYVFAIALKHFEMQLPNIGIDADYPLFVYTLDKIQAVISKVPLDVYGKDALQTRLNDPAWFQQTLKIHNLVLAQIQSQAAIVPMRVCTICDSMESLKAFLREHHDDFVSTLELIAGNEAWRLSIVCNYRRLRHLTERASNRVRAIHAEMAGKTGDTARVLADKLESVIDEEVRSVCRACVKHSHGVLGGLSAGASMLAPAGGTAVLQEIFKCEYLVSGERAAAFGAEAENLVASYKSLGFELHIEGPLPPSRFTGKKVLLPGSNEREPQRSEVVAPIKAGSSTAEA